MMRACAVVVLVIACGVPSLARAAETDPPCLADIQRWCTYVPDTGGFVQGCLEQHFDDLSADCRKNVGTTTRNDLKLRSACRSDTDRFCSGGSNVGGDRVGCLLKHREELSQSCRDVLDDEAGKRKDVLDDEAAKPNEALDDEATKRTQTP